MRALAGIAAFLVGAIVGYALSIAAYVAVTEIGGVVDRDGGLAMGFAFFIGPLVALVFGIAGAVVALRKKRGAARSR